MEKILLCGNGINIQFNEKFQLAGFIKLLKNEEKLMLYFDDIFKNSKNEKFKNYFNFFLKVLKKSESSLDNLVLNAQNNGVENAIFEFLKIVDKYMGHKKDNKEIYDIFEEMFKELFFYYLWLLELNQQSMILKTGLYDKFKNKLDSYMYIYTLNYDSILEQIVSDINKEDIIHLHGHLLQDKNGSLNYKNCLLETYRKPKVDFPLPDLEIIRNRKKFVGAFSLDVIGLNPINDVTIFTILINSKIFHSINFYYFSDKDLENFKKIILLIDKLFIYDCVEYPKYHLRHVYMQNQNKQLNIFEAKVDEINKKIQLHFNDDSKCEIKLLNSKAFWDFKILSDLKIKTLRDPKVVEQLNIKETVITGGVNVMKKTETNFK